MFIPTLRMCGERILRGNEVVLGEFGYLPGTLYPERPSTCIRSSPHLGLDSSFAFCDYLLVHPVLPRAEVGLNAP